MNGPSAVRPFYTYVLTDVEPGSLFPWSIRFPCPWIGKEKTARSRPPTTALHVRLPVSSQKEVSGSEGRRDP